MQNELNEYYINLLRPKYIGKSKSEKSKLLDEAIEFTGLSRKTIIKKISEPKMSRTSCSKGRPRIYDDIINHLIILKALMGDISEKRIKEAIPLWLPYYKDHYGGTLTGRQEKLLRKVSSSTIGRLIKRGILQKGLSTTKSNERMKVQIPLKKLDEEVTTVGTIQADTVAHCGDYISGKYAHTVTAVDIWSGWTENRAVWTKEAKPMVNGIKGIEESFPFELKNFDTDCGTEFLNFTVMEFLEKRNRPIKMRRSRPYKKNDQCYVEQKNFTHVRKLFEYARLDNEDLVELMNDIYENYWNPLHNYFIPSFKLESKERINSKIVKIHDAPKTPAQRIIENKNINKHVRNRIISKQTVLDPIILKRELNKKVEIFRKMLENHIIDKAA